MKKVLRKELLREIWKTKNRFLSILAIIAVGTGFFAGVKVCCPDMKLTATHYFADTRLMDLHLKSTLGFTDEDVDAIKNTDGIRGMMPAYSVDSFVQATDNTNIIVKALSIPTGAAEEDENYLNRPVLKEGRLPENSGECVVEHSSLANVDFSIGSKITLYLKTSDIGDSLKTDTFTIVGVIESPQYISFSRGNSLIGDGSIDAFMMIPEQDFNIEVYTDLYLTLDSTKGVSPFEEEYDRLVEEKAATLEEIAEHRAQLRYEEIHEDAQAEIDQAKQELADGEKTRNEELSKVEKQLASAKKELDDGYREYQDGQTAYQEQIADAQTQLENGKQELADGQAEYESGLKQYQQGLLIWESELSSGKEQLNGAKATVAGINSILENYETVSIADPADFPDKVQQTIAAAQLLAAADGSDGSAFANLLTGYIQAPAEQKPTLKAAALQAVGTINANLSAQESVLNAGFTKLNALKEGKTAEGMTYTEEEQKLVDSNTLLTETAQKLTAAKQELAEKEALLAVEKEKGLQELADAKQKLTDGQAEYDKGFAEYESQKTESGEKLEEARKKIKEAENKLAELAEPVWYVWDRDNNPGYSGYEEDAEKVDAIAKVFPVFFVLVAALVCLTTMTRMVEEQRTQIGTMKALGYGKRTIVSKYLLYAITASVIGSAIGLTVGFQLFPRVIIRAYSIMYYLPDPMTPFRWDYAVACTAVAVLCTGVSAFAACNKALSSGPAKLMRPRAPKSGKRVLLERITFIWSKLSFIHKVTLRNIFRYKRRVAMTIIGIAGCTALMLTGFGLKYSISSIADKQYGNIFVYDAIAVMEDDVTDTAPLQDFLNGIDGVKQSIKIVHRSLDATNGSVIKNINLYVPQEPEQIGDYINLRERIGHQKLSLNDDGVIINEKLAKLLSLSTGDDITLNNPDGRPITVPITGVCENYALNYVYMSPALYESSFRTEPAYNTFLFNVSEDCDRSAAAEQLLDHGGFLGVSYSSEGMGRFTDMMGSLNSIVWVLIISAGALAFIVMYNLVNINVNERIRELATIKVLGFYDKEVSAYIYRENNIAAAFGIMIGLILGVFLERFVIVTAEVDAVMFAPDISAPCFLFAAALTILFTLIVNITLHFQLKKINMVESLKSVE